MKQGQAKVSVIIPAYNAEKYLPECLDSILNQTLDDIQIIINNDGSTDNTQQVIDQYAKKYPDTIIAMAQENAGQSAARNAALKYVTGKYMAYIDADDYIEPDYFQKLYEAAEQNQSDLVICSYEKFTNDGKIVLSRNSVDWDIEFDTGKRHVFQYSPCAKIYLSKLILDNHILFGEGEKMEDGPYGIITGSVARNPVVLDYFGYHYRVYNESTMGQIRKKGISKDRPEQQFPYKGIEQAILKVREVRGQEYDNVLEYAVIKALAGFTFVFCAKSGKETLKYVCQYCNYIIEKYFPDMRKNPYMHLWKLKKLPFSHRAAVVLFKYAYQMGILYQTASIYIKVSGKSRK